ncbi:hypothetical protein KKH39_03660 [Patescibacteria group bacterium]|nr:hypothetical protein [Patescibacteria group bacterium]
MFKDKNNLLFILLSGLIGLGIFMFVYSETLDPRYDAWIFTTGHDTTQSYVGWIMYRNSDWTFPIGIAKNYAYPIGASISSADSIPILAIPFKVIRNFLPTTFQYFGFWIMLCFVFQAIFGFLLAKIFLKDDSLSILASVFFVFSPTMLFRLGGHFALGGHFLILAGLYLLLKKQIKSYIWWWPLLMASLLVHPYLLFINFFLFLAHTLILWTDKNINTLKLFLYIFLQIIFVLLLTYVLGLFSLSSAGAPGFGDFSMNLNAIFNPLGWSKILPDWPLIRYQEEGFNYLGLGSLILVFFSFYYFIKNKKYKKAGGKYWPIFLVLLILFFLAISNTVAISDKILWTVALPKMISEDILGIFRSSGRLFWPIYYLLMLGSFYILKNIKYNWSIILMAIFLLMQVYDLSHKVYYRGLEFEGQLWQNQYLEKEMPIIARGYKHISFLPLVPHRNYMDYAIFAANNNMTINNGFFARQDENLDKHIEQEIKEVKGGLIQTDTIYIFSRDHEDFIKNLDMSQHLLTQIDNTFVLSPYYKQK